MESIVNHEFEENEEIEVVEASLPYAGFWIRFWAYIVDLIVIESLIRLIVRPTFRLLDYSLTSTEWNAPIVIVSALVFYLYFVLMVKFTSQTIGKMIFNLKVVSHKNDASLTWLTILFREWIGRFISKFIVIGYLIIGVMPKKQGLHDLFADTAVVYDRKS